MEKGTIFDLKMYADQLLEAHSFLRREDKIRFEYKLKQVLQQLIQIQIELSHLNKSASYLAALVPEYRDEDDELSCLIRRVKERVKSLPSEPVQAAFNENCRAVSVQ